MKVPYTIASGRITLVLNKSRVRTVDKTHINYNEVLQLLKDPNTTEQDLMNAVDIPTFIVKKSFGEVTITEDNTVLLRGKEMNGALVDRMIDGFNNGFDVQHLVNFMLRCESNPRPEAIAELFLFLEKSQLPITPDGFFIAFKKVNDNYTDIHTGKFDNKIGSVPEMKFEDVDPNRHNTCSRGLHWCSFSYLPSFAGNTGRVMTVLVDPADVVAIPSDYNNTKGRSCKYAVIGEVPQEEAAFAFGGRLVVESYGTYDADESKENVGHLESAPEVDDSASVLVFKNNEGVSFTPSEVTKGIAVNGKAGYGRIIGVHPDTLRRWEKKITAATAPEEIDDGLQFTDGNESAVSSIKLIKLIKKNGTTETARILGRSSSTVRKWMAKVREARGTDVFATE